MCSSDDLSLIHRTSDTCLTTWFWFPYLVMSLLFIVFQNYGAVTTLQNVYFHLCVHYWREGHSHWQCHFNSIDTVTLDILFNAHCKVCFSMLNNRGFLNILCSAMHSKSCIFKYQNLKMKYFMFSNVYYLISSHITHMVTFPDS